MNLELKWQQEKAWRVRYDSDYQDCRNLWMDRATWGQSRWITSSWPETYHEWKDKVEHPEEQHPDPRGATLPPQNWKWEQELVWRERYDREKECFYRWHAYDVWNQIKPLEWPEHYSLWCLECYNHRSSN